MNRPTNIALLALVAIATVVAERTLITPNQGQAVSQALAPEVHQGLTLEGEVLSVDPLANDEASSLARKARVKLRTGETVVASIGGCVVLPGQTARLLKYDHGAAAFYVVAENGRSGG